MSVEFDRIIERGSKVFKTPRTDRCKGFKKNNCAVQIPEYTGRCESCQTDFQSYADSGYGLDAIVEERLHNVDLGLCMFCGAAKKDARLCSDCEYSTKERTFVLEHHKAKRALNPYINVFDRIEDHEELDGQMVLVPNGDTMAQRHEATARYWQEIADREEGGPRSRHAAQEAHDYRQIAQKMRDFHEKVKRFSR